MRPANKLGHSTIIERNSKVQHIIFLLAPRIDRFCDIDAGT